MGMKVAVIDNGGQYAHRIMRTFQDVGAEAMIIPNTTPVEEINADAIAFSGSGLRIGEGEVDPMGNCRSYLDNFQGPILGMCAGHQLIAIHFGGKVGPAETPEFGKTEITITKKPGIFDNLPQTFTVWNSHNDEVTELPDCFESLASSKDCKYEAIKHKEKPVFGIQFHPEVQNTEHGTEIFKNFLEGVQK